jgi:uncharacterized protein (TIGR02246 family)
MRYRLMIGVSAIGIGLTCALAFAQNRAGGANESQAILKATEAYVQAFNLGNLDGVLAVWSDDAESIDENGKITKGKKALAEMYKNSFHENPGLKVQIKTSSLQVIKNDIALQDGNAVLSFSAGQTENCPFTAVWMKQDGRWLLQRVRDLPSQSEGALQASKAGLQDLGWLIGQWTNEDKGQKTTLVGRWMKGHKFLVLNYAVHTKGEEILSLTQIVGQDPLTAKLHSWVFDSRGGLGEGSWSRNNETWTAAVAGFTSDGLHCSGTNVWSRVDDNTFTFQSLDREIDGQRLPDVKVTYSRTKTGSDRQPHAQETLP